jgi:DNA-binding XRE family transcriptional regulator
MDDLQRAIEKRKSIDPEFAEKFDKGYEEFKIGVLLKEARKNAGLTQEALAEKLKTRKSAISRIENHADDIRLSTLYNYAEALGKKIQFTIQ